MFVELTLPGRRLPVAIVTESPHRRRHGTSTESNGAWPAIASSQIKGPSARQAVMRVATVKARNENTISLVNPEQSTLFAIISEQK